MHPIAHQHLVHTEVGDQPKRIENQMCTTSLPSVFRVMGSGIRAWAMKGAVFAKIYHRVIAATTKDFWDIRTRNHFFNRPSPVTAITPFCITTMTCTRSLARLLVMFLKYAYKQVICDICILIKYTYKQVMCNMCILISEICIQIYNM